METRIFAIVFIVASMVFLGIMVPGLHTSYSTNPMFQTSGLGPAAVPYFAGGAVLLLSVLMLFERPAESEAGGSDIDDSRENAGNLFLFVAILTASIVAMPYLGFLLSSMAFLGTTFLAFRSGSVVVPVLLTVLSPIAIDLLLRNVFLIPLPEFKLF